MNTHKRYRKQVRGGDIARAIAFGTFPTVRNIRSVRVGESKGSASGAFEVTIVVDRTFTTFTHTVSDIHGCLRLAREVNKELRYLAAIDAPDATSQEVTDL